MLSILKKLNVISENTKTISKGQKKNEDSIQNIKGFCIIDDFINITKESFNETAHNFNKKEIMKKFSKEIISIILDSRKDNNKNTLLNDCKKNYENSFNIDIDELFLYDNLSKEKNDTVKFSIEFYLTKNKKDKIISELIEKWKFSYKLNNDEIGDENNDNFNINKIKKNLILLKKSIINYTRLLPLYHHMINKDKNGYSIEFKFYHNKTKNIGVFLYKDFRKFSFINKDLFSFKLNIKYISRKEINNIINESNNIENTKDILFPEITNKTKSLSCHKSKPFLKGFEIINFFVNDNNPINENENFNRIKECQTEINNSIIKEIDLNSSSSSLYLNICDEEIENYNKRKISKKEKENKMNLKKEIENIRKRKCSTLSNSNDMTEDCTPRNNESKVNENQQIKNTSYINKNIMIYRKDNIEINSIIKEYTLLLDMMKDSPKFGNIKIKKLIRYRDSFE